MNCGGFLQLAIATYCTLFPPVDLSHGFCYVVSKCSIFIRNTPHLGVQICGVGLEHASQWLALFKYFMGHYERWAWQKIFCFSFFYCIDQPCWNPGQAMLITQTYTHHSTFELEKRGVCIVCMQRMKKNANSGSILIVWIKNSVLVWTTWQRSKSDIFPISTSLNKKEASFVASCPDLSIYLRY